MTDKKWTDKLRQQMSEYTETPPEGLWEGIESVAGRKGKAKGGFWAWLVGSPGMWPVWATAGVAAAAAAVLLLRTPAEPVVTPKSDTPVIAQVDNTDSTTDITEVSPSLPDDTSTVTDTPAAGKSNHAVVANTPSRNVMPDPIGHPTEDVMPDPIGHSAETEPKEDQESEKQEDIRPVWTPEPSGTTTVPISRLRKRSKPLLAATLVGGNAPGGGSTATSNAYGFSNPSGYSANKADINPKMAMLGRNKNVQTDVSHRQDYQFGLLLNYMFNDRWGLESGVMATGLSSATTESTGTITRAKKESFTYLGVPLRVVYYPFRYKSLSIYTSAGPAAEYGVYSSWESHDIMGDKELNPQSGTSRPGDWVFSASLNAGVQWQPWQYGAFFIQPGVVGRLTGDNSPESFYTTHPVSFQLSAGYKITF